VCNTCKLEGAGSCFDCLSTFPVWSPQAASAFGWAKPETYECVEKVADDASCENYIYEGTPAGQIPNPPWNSTPPTSPQQAQNDSSMPADDKDDDTTRMICNIPCKFGYGDIVEAISAAGFGGLYDFVLVPVRSVKRGGNVGYAYVHFKTPEMAAQFTDAFQNYQIEGSNSIKRYSVKRAHLHGLQLMSPGEVEFQSTACAWAGLQWNLVNAKWQTSTVGVQKRCRAMVARALSY